MPNNPVSDGNQLHGGEVFLDSVYDGVDRLQEDGGIAPEIVHRPSSQEDAPPPRIMRRRSDMPPS